MTDLTEKMSARRACVFFSLISLAAATDNKFIFNGFGKFLCEHYGGTDETAICNPGREVRGTVPSDCPELCTDCPEAELLEDIQAFTDPHPATDENGIGPQTDGDPTPTNDRCDAASGYTVILTRPFAHAGQLTHVKFNFERRCQVTAPGNTEIVFGIFRKKATGDCDFDVIAELHLGRSNINSILSPKQDGVVEYKLLDIEKNMMQFEQGDHFGFTWSGSGAVSYNPGTSGSNNICMDNIGAWRAGDSIQLNTTPKRSARVYSIGYSYMPR